MERKDLEIYKQAIANKGILCLKAEDFRYGDFLIPCFAELIGVPLEKQICRVVQIRKEIGQFGSDVFFVRHADGDLITWENQSFYKVEEKYLNAIKEIFQRNDAIELDDQDKNFGYNWSRDKVYKSGFIIPSPYSAEHVTPMRLVKEGIENEIKKFI